MIEMLRKLLFIWVLCYFALRNGNCKRKQRIIDGEYASAKDFKYMIAILEDSEFKCGGGIIDERFVLTAAHCFTDLSVIIFSPNRFEILAATNNSRDIDSGIKIGVEEVYLHHFYNKDNDIVIPDIAVLKLERSLEIERNSDKLQSLKLPNETLGSLENSGPHKIVFAGFGYSNITEYDFDGRTEYVKSDDGPLKYAEAEIMRYDDCLSQYSQTVDAQILEFALCLQMTQNPTVGKRQATCYGDSGSPLVFNNTIVGVHKIGHYCRYPNDMPSLSTRVSSFIPFIENAMKGNFTEMIVYNHKTDETSIFD